MKTLLILLDAILILITLILLIRLFRRVRGNAI